MKTAPFLLVWRYSLPWRRQTGVLLHKIVVKGLTILLSSVFDWKSFKIQGLEQGGVAAAWCARALLTNVLFFKVKVPLPCTGQASMLFKLCMRFFLLSRRALAGES